MNRKNATVLFLSKFVTEYGKDNLQFNVKITYPHLAYVPMLTTYKIWIVRMRLSSLFYFLLRFVTDYGKDNSYFNVTN